MRDESVLRSKYPIDDIAVKSYVEASVMPEPLGLMGRLGPFYRINRAQ